MSVALPAPLHFVAAARIPVVARPEPHQIPPIKRMRLGTGYLPPDPVPYRVTDAPHDLGIQELPDPTAVCAAVTRAAVEVLRGQRPVAQLARWVTPAVLGQLTERARLLTAAGERKENPGVSFPARIRRVRVDYHDSAVEASVVIDDNGRCRAAALRVEEYRGQWRVVVLELG
jgi:hypothetical protein